LWIDPVQIVVAGTGEADHLPANHVAVAAVDRVGEEAHVNVADDLLEKRFSVHPFELDLFVFEPFEQLVFSVIVQIRESLAVLRAAVAIECRQPLAIRFGRTTRPLRPLVLCAMHEGRPVVMTFRAAVRPGKLPVDKDGAPSVLSAGRLRIGRDDPIRQRFDGGRLVEGEKLPRSRPHRRWRIAAVWIPG